jgi:hypothetical protein
MKLEAYLVVTFIVFSRLPTAQSRRANESTFALQSSSLSLDDGAEKRLDSSGEISSSRNPLIRIMHTSFPPGRANAD